MGRFHEHSQWPEDPKIQGPKTQDPGGQAVAEGPLRPLRAKVATRASLCARLALTLSIVHCPISAVQAQTTAVAPRLVVTLTIDQLRTDYLEDFAPLYGEKGFKRVMREGRMFRQTDFDFDDTDRSSAMATLYTGTTPSLHGIIANQWLDINTLQRRECVDDVAFMGNYTNESSSPALLLTSTLADELRVGTQGKGLVYSIAPFRDAAILGAGHAGNSALWLNQTTGKWCSTTYYSEFPWWVSQYNQNHSADIRIKDMIWTPLHPASAYTFLPEWKLDAFRHKLDADKLNRFHRLALSPLGNEEVNRLARVLLEKSTIGRDDTPDLLALTYYGGNYNHKTIAECAMEMQDTYARLDLCLAELLDMLEQYVGLKHVLLCIASTGYADPEGADLGMYKVPGGEFYLNRCATLLNMYLMATYGEGQYVESYDDLQIYLNHKLIESKSLNLADIQEKSAQFLVQFSGVNRVYSADRLLLGPWSPQAERVRNGYHHKRSGDLLIEVLPGWTVMREKGDEDHTVRYGHVATPLILMGAGVKAGTVSTPLDINRVAPTLAGAMRIRAPNACTGIAIDLE